MKTLRDIIGIAKEIPEKYFEEVFNKLSEVREKANAEKETESRSKVCQQCASSWVVRNGKRNGVQAYMCRSCGKTFVETAGSAIANSHSSSTVWRQVIRDTVEGISIDKTAANLNLNHDTVFNMRHKILFQVERELEASPIMMAGVCEADETYVLEDEKGWKFPEDYHRAPRKRGGKASKRGLSDEQICICTSVNSDNECIAVTVNRAAPDKSELEHVFGSRIMDDTVILCDGNKKYNIFEDKCTVAHINHPNKANGFHSFIKTRIRDARGLATKYQNRYNAFFAKIFGKDTDETVDNIFNLIISPTGGFSSICTVKSRNLLNI